MRLDRIKIVEYVAVWAGQFEQQRARIEPRLADWLAAPIEHIGRCANDEDRPAYRAGNAPFITAVLARPIRR
jgi:hypothetical protein